MFDLRSLPKELRNNLPWGRKGPEFHRILAGVGEGITSQNSASLGTSWSEKLFGRTGNYCCKLASTVWTI